MSQIVLTDIALGPYPRSTTTPCFLDDEQVFIDIFGATSLVDTDKTPPVLKIRRFGPLTKVTNTSLWGTEESFEARLNIRSLKIVVSVDNPKLGCFQVGSIELDTDYLLDASLDRDNKFCKVLFSSSNNSRLLVTSTCIYIAPDQNLSLNVVPSPQNQLIWESNNDKSIRLNKAGEYFLRRYLRLHHLGDVDKAISYLKHAVHLTPEDHPDKCSRLNSLGGSFLYRFKHSGDLRDIDEAISLYEHILNITPDGHPDRLGYLDNLGSSFLERFGHSGHPLDVDKAISHRELAVRLAPDDHSDKPRCLNNLGNSFLTRFRRAGDLMDLENAISHHKHALRLIPDGHSDKHSYVSNLGSSFLTRFEHSGDIKDIGKAISHYEHALNITPRGHVDMPGSLNNLGGSLMARFERSGNLMDIDKAISYRKYAVHLTPDDRADKPGLLNNLGSSFLTRFLRSGDLVDVEEAISHHGDAVDLTPDGHADRPGHLNNLGNSFLARFWHLGDLIDIDKAISNHEHALHLIPDDHSNKPSLLNNLGNSLLTRFKNLGNLIDTDKAISHHQHALRLTPDGHADKPGRLNNLGISFLARFERSEDLTDVEQAISHHEHAVCLIPDGHTDKPGCLDNLGNSFLARFGHLGDPIDINRAISHREHALRLTPDSHSDKRRHLSNLGHSYLTRFRHFGDLIDIDKAISHLEHALLLIPDGHADMPSCLNNLGNSFLARYDHSADLIDLARAITHHKRALHLTPDGHADKPGRLSNLGSTFLTRFRYSRDLTDVDKAISYYEHGLRLTPDGHSERPHYMNNLGNSFLNRFEHSGDTTDNDQAISYQEQALCLIPDGHADKPHCLNNLGSSFFDRFGHSEDLQDINKAIFHHEHAVRLTPDGHAGKIGCLRNLGHSFARRFEHTRNGTDLQLAMVAFEDCVTSAVGDPYMKFEAALDWARLSSRELEPSASMSGYEAAIALLPRIVWLGQPLSFRYERLASIGGLATEAAAAAIASDRLDLALQWLEQGRSIVWSQLLNLRTPVDKLRKVKPNVADELLSTSRALENASARGIGYSLMAQKMDSRLPLEETAQSHRRLAERWDSLLKSVRMLPGFENFLLPKKLPELSRAAGSGPVAVINVHKSRSGALILLSGLEDVVHIPLDSNLYDKTHVLQRSLGDELRAAGMGIRDARAGRLAPQKHSDYGFENILASLWADVVKPVLDGLAFSSPSPSELPRIWWCLTGPLTFLPVHAAGLYNQSSGDLELNISDFVISSYTPTLAALLETSQKSFKGLLGVSQSNTPGLSRLPNADRELDLVEHFDASLNVRSLRGESATVERVLKGMEEASWVHLACHAIQEPSSPMHSAFCLQNGHLTLSKLATKSFPNADFAFLSACETATGNEKLPEESVHLAAGMLTAGYRSVIATMWQIGDNDAPLIASEVYPRLVAGPAPDSSLAAHALHHAVKRLREKVGTTGSRAFLSWVPFIHVGK